MPSPHAPRPPPTPRTSQAVEALVTQIEAAERKFQVHAVRKFSPEGAYGFTLAAGGAKSGAKRKAAVKAEDKAAAILAYEEAADAITALEEKEDKAAAKTKKARTAVAPQKKPQTANEFLDSLSREVLKVLRQAAIINAADQLIKAKALHSHEYRAIAKLTSTDPPSAHPKIFERLIKWGIILPEGSKGEEEEEEEEEEEDGEDGDDDEDHEGDDDDEGDEGDDDEDDEEDEGEGEGEEHGAKGGKGLGGEKLTVTVPK